MIQNKNTFIIIILMFLMIVILAIQYFKIYKQNLYLSLHPVGKVNMVIDTSKTVLAIGSSTINRWPFERIGILKNNIINLGVEGQTSEQVKIEYIYILEKYKPKIIIINIGINDIKTIGFLGEKKTIAEKLVQNIKSILKKSIELNIEPIYISNFPTDKPGLIRRFFWNEEMDKLIIQTNNEIIDFCKISNINYIDAYQLLVDPLKGYKRTSDFSYDFFHLNERGYQILNNHLENKLKQILK